MITSCRLIQLQKKVQNGTATEEEIAFLKQERDILLYQAKKKLDAKLSGETLSRRAKPGTKRDKPQSTASPPPGPVNKTADMKAYMAEYRCAHRAELNNAKNQRYHDDPEVREKALAYQRERNRKKKLPLEPEYYI